MVVAMVLLPQPSERFEMAKKPHVKAPEPAPVAEVAEQVIADIQKKFVHNKKLAVNGSSTADSAITWHTATNPRSPGKGTFERFAKYLGAATVGEYMAAGGTKGDLMWDLRSGYLSIDGVTLGGELTPRAPRAPKAEKPAKAKRGRKAPAPEPEAVAEVEDLVQEETID